MLRLPCFRQVQFCSERDVALDPAGLMHDSHCSPNIESALPFQILIAFFNTIHGKRVRYIQLFASSLWLPFYVLKASSRKHLKTTG